MSDVADIKTSLATIIGGVEGVKRTYAYAPASLPPGNLPAAVIMTGKATYKRQGYQTSPNPDRTFTVMLYAKNSGQGIDGEGERLCEPFFERIATALAASPRLGLDSVMLATLRADSGVVKMTFSDAVEIYIGTIFEILVEMM